jgi:thioredoxin-like negative regulator of GroEL
MKVYELTTQEQIEKIANKFPQRLIIIDFWASWCGPCVEMKPVFKEFAKQHQDGIFISIDIDKDESGEITKLYNIQSIPLFVFIKDHNVIDFMMGANKAELLNKISENLKKVMPTDPFARPEIEKYQNSLTTPAQQPMSQVMEPQNMPTFHNLPPPPQVQQPMQQQVHQSQQQDNYNRSGDMYRQSIMREPSEMAPPPPQPQFGDMNGQIQGQMQYNQLQQQQQMPYGDPNGGVDSLPSELYN